MIKVIDNFVNASYYKEIENGILGVNFTWHWNASISAATNSNASALYSSPTNSNLFGFSHRLFNAEKPTSPFYEFLLPMFLQAKGETYAEVLLRARGVMTIISGEQVTYEPHIDISHIRQEPYIDTPAQATSTVNMIFYIGDSDGDTIIYKEKFFPQEPYVEPQQPKILTEEQRISPKANRLLIFSGEHWHTGQSPKNHSRRVWLNLNFAKNDYRKYYE